MPIVTTCACGFRFKAPDKLAGRKARCPKCSEIVHIPALEAEAVSAPIEEAAPPAEARKTSPGTETDEGPSALPRKALVDTSDFGPAPEVAPAASPDETKPAEEAKPETAPVAPQPAAASPTKTRTTGRFRRDSGEKGTAKTEKPAAKVEMPAPKPAKPAGPAQPSAIGEFLNFKRMITPSIVKLLFWLGEGLLVLYGLGSVISAVVMMTARHGDVVSGLIFLVVGPVSTVLFMLMWRVMCESALLYFQMFDRLGEIRDLLSKPKEVPAAGAGPAQVAPVVPATSAPELAVSPAPEIPPVVASAAAEPATASPKLEPAPASE